jgi:hypothetical protein
MEEVLKQNRPELSASSVYNYSSSLKKLYRDATGRTDYSLSIFNDVPLMKEALKDRPSSSKQTIFSYLYVLTKNPEFQNAMQEAKSTNQERVASQPPTDPDKTTTMKEVKALFKGLKKEATEVYRTGEYTPENILKIQDMLLLALLGNLYIPPRRAMDYTELLIRGKDPNANYIDGTHIVFNKYKTMKTYGSQSIPIPSPLQKLLTKYYLTFPEATYLFTTIKGKKLTGKQLWDRLHAIFGKSVSVNALRRAFITDTYSEYDKKTKQLESDMRGMGSSPAVFRYYCRPVKS